MLQDINGVTINRLKVVPDERGWLMEILRCDDPLFEKFGQVYITTAYPEWSKRGTIIKNRLTILRACAE